MGVFRFSTAVSIFVSCFLSSSAVSLKCSCSNDVCKAAVQFSSDFYTSKQLCEEMKGQMMTVQSKSASDDVGDLLMDLPGDYWIGLRLPDGHCTNDTLPWKGYIWTTGYQSTEFTNWKNTETVCAPRCVSVSADQNWNEKLCEVQSAGFLCENVPEDNCFFEDPTYSADYPDPLHCLLSPCEHKCDITPNGYRCSCDIGFVINRKNQTLCDFNCSASCSALCDINFEHDCLCMQGYTLDETDHYCEDINECENDYCDHYCFNTFGSYECSCRDGFRLVGKSKCVKTTTVPVAEVSPDSVIGVTPFVLVAIVALVFFVAYIIANKQKTNTTSVRYSTEAVKHSQPRFPYV